MKKLFSLAILTLAAILVCGATGFAQDNQQTFHMNVPFDFQIGPTHFPAGRYSFMVDPEKLIVHSADGKTAAVVLAEDKDQANEADQSALQFRRLNGTAQLMTIHTFGSDYVLQFAGASNSHFASKGAAMSAGE
jgi:hypothetical protein